MTGVKISRCYHPCQQASAADKITTMIQGAAEENFTYSRTSIYPSLKGICDFNKPSVNHADSF